MILLSGITVRDELKQRIKSEVASLLVPPKLVILQIGSNEESNIYINQKKKFGESVGIMVVHKVCEDDVNEDEFISIIEGFNKDSAVTGIIVQLPIPKNLNKSKILNPKFQISLNI